MLSIDFQILRVNPYPGIPKQNNLNPKRAPAKLIDIIVLTLSP